MNLRLDLLDLIDLEEDLGETDSLLEREAHVS